MQFALQCYVDENLHALVRAAADAAHMSVSQWLKLTVIDALDEPQDEAFRDQVLADLLFTKIALDGWLRTHKDKELRDRVVVAYQRRIPEYRERKAAKREGR
ncbi:MAG: hypothetical protein AAF291_09765 [Pseudomonadota bacterium]